MKVYLGYIIVLIVLNIFLKTNKVKKNRNLFLGIALILILFISCFRAPSVGIDTYQYYSIYKSIAKRDLDECFQTYRFEKGYIVFCKLLTTISENPQFLIIVSSIIINCAVFYFIKENSVNPFLSVLYYVFLNYYFWYLSAMRQALAIAIILIGYTLFYKNNRIKEFYITIFIATLFHTSAIFSFFLFLIPNKFKYNKFIFGISILISIIAFAFSNFIFVILAGKYSYYIGSSFMNGSNFAGYISYIITLCFLVFAHVFAKDRIIEDEYFNNYIFILSINLILCSLSIKTSIFSRLTPYCEIYNCIFLPYVLNNIKIESNKKIIMPFLNCMAFLYWIVVLLYRPEWFGAVPYISVF